MPVNSSSNKVLVYTLNIEINLLQHSPKYPKNPQNFGQRLRKKRMDLGLNDNLTRLKTHHSNLVRIEGKMNE